MNDMEKLLRADLHDVAGSVEIPVSLEAITAREAALAGRASWSRWALVALVVAVVVAVAWSAQALMVRPPDRAVPNPLQTPTATTSPTAEPSPTPSAPVSSTPSPTGTVRMTPMFVYFASDHGLVRELWQVPAGTPARAGALEAMLGTPRDPDYRSLWNPGTRVLGLSRSGGVITVDLSGEALPVSLGSATEALMVDTLIWTLTEAFEPTDTVTITVEGRPYESGHLSFDRPQGRATGPNSPIRLVVDTPAQGATVDAPVRVAGLATAFEAVLEWTVTRPDGTTVADGTARTDEGMTLAPFAFDLPTLDPGSYTLRVSVPDASGGDGPTPASDTKDFTVR